MSMRNTSMNLPKSLNIDTPRRWFLRLENKNIMKLWIDNGSIKPSLPIQSFVVFLLSYLKNHLHKVSIFIDLCKVIEVL